MPEPCVGIDLGTTFSAIAVVTPEGVPEIVPNREGERIMPSVVYFDQSEPIIGTIAKRAATRDPTNSVQFVKRQMGNALWRFETESGRTYKAEEISALILKRLKDDVEAILQKPVTEAVVTVPAYFNDAQRKATQDAGVIAGLKVLRILNEPTAAALAYAHDNIRKHREPEIGQTVMVYDLGGGTFDVTILRLEGTKIDVLATDGDRSLGGFDWDNALMVHLNEEFKRVGGSDLLEDPLATELLREQAEQAKKSLSFQEQTRVYLSAAGHTATIHLNRKQVESITGHLLRRTEDLMEASLEAAHLGWGQLDKVLLVGGSTRMPAVRALVQQLLGREPSCELHPDEVVAIGAAIMGALLRRRTSASAASQPVTPELAVVDVNAHSLGVVAVDSDSERSYNSVILPKNTRLPASANERYHTVADWQKSIRVQVTEGEEESLDGNVRIIGEGTMPIPSYPAGAPIDIQIGYDLDGLVQIRVMDLTSKEMLGTLEIERKSNLTKQEVERMRASMNRLPEA